MEFRPKETNFDCPAPLGLNRAKEATPDSMDNTLAQELEFTSRRLQDALRREHTLLLDIRMLCYSIVRGGNMEVLRKALWEDMHMNSVKEIVRSIAATTRLPVVSLDPNKSACNNSTNENGKRPRSFPNRDAPPSPVDVPTVRFSDFSDDPDFDEPYDPNQDLVGNLGIGKRPRMEVPKREY